MFKNFKQKLEKLSANTPPGKLPTPDEQRDSLSEKSGDLVEKNEKNDDAPEQTTVLDEVSAPHNQLEKTDDVHPEQSLKPTEWHMANNSHSDEKREGVDNSDWSSVSKEELLEQHLKLIKKNKTLQEQSEQQARKVRRRIGELEEQVVLDGRAKRDLEHSYALMLDEKDELIAVLKTQVQLLKANQQQQQQSPSMDDSTASSDVLEPPITLEEIGILKDKVKRLESLLTKCKETIKSNKEKTKQMVFEKEELVKSNEEKIKELQLKHEKELKSKMADLQEEVSALSQVRKDLNEQLLKLGKELTEQKEFIRSKVKDLSIPKKASDVSTTEDTPATVASDSSELEETKQLLDLKLKELEDVLNDRTKLREELASQRDRFASVLGRYDEQMQVIQEELKEKMKPGPVESMISGEVWAVLREEAGEKLKDEVPAEHNESIISETKVNVATVVDDNKQKVPLAEIIAGEPVTSGSSDQQPATDLKKDLETAENKISKLLVLLQKCAKQMDARNAEDSRWTERLAEAEISGAAQLRDSKETIARLNEQILELTNRENQLNANLERARQESEEILRQQRLEMADLQNMVRELLSQEEHLKTQMSKTKMMCDAEVARVTAENAESVQRLSEMFETTQSAVKELSQQLMESKEQSDQMISALGMELDEKCRMLQATADFIEANGDALIKGGFMKIIVECGSGEGLAEIDAAIAQAASGINSESSSIPVSTVSTVEANAATCDSISKNLNCDDCQEVQTKNLIEVVDGLENVSIENHKSSVDKKKVELSLLPRGEQDLLNLDFPESQIQKGSFENVSKSSTSSSGEKHLLNCNTANIDAAVITRLCSRRTTGEASLRSSSEVKIAEKKKVDQTQRYEVSRKAGDLEREVNSLKLSLVKSRQKCCDLERESVDLVEGQRALSTENSRLKEDYRHLKEKFNIASKSLESEKTIRSEESSKGDAEKSSNHARISQLEDKVKVLMDKLESSEVVMMSLQENNLRLVDESSSATEQLRKYLDKEKCLLEENSVLKERLAKLEVDFKDLILLKEGELMKKDAELGKIKSQFHKGQERLKESEEQKVEIGEELNVLKKQLDDQKFFILSCESRLKDYGQNKLEVEKILESEKHLRETVANLNSERSKLEESQKRNLECLQEKFNENESVLKATMLERDELIEETGNIKDNLDKERIRVTEMEIQVKNIKLELDEISKNEQKLLADIAVLKIENEDCKEKLVKSKSKLQAILGCNEEIKAKHNESIKVLEMEKSQVLKLTQQIEDHKKLAEEANSFAALLQARELTVENLSSSAACLSAENNQLRQEKDTLEIKLKELQSVNVELEESIKDLRDCLNLKDLENAELVKKLKLLIDESRANQSSQAKELEEVKERSLQCDKMMAEMEIEITKLSSTLCQKNDLISEFSKKLDVLTVDLSNEKTSSELKQSVIAEKDAVISSCRLTFEGTQMSLRKIREDILFLKSSCASLEAENKMLKDDAESKDKLISLLQTNSNVSKSELSQVEVTDPDKSASSDAYLKDKSEDESFKAIELKPGGTEHGVGNINSEMIVRMSRELDMNEKVEEHEKVAYENQWELDKLKEELVHVREQLLYKISEYDELAERHVGLVQKFEEEEISHRRQHIHYCVDATEVSDTAKNETMVNNGDGSNIEDEIIAVDRNHLDKDPASMSNLPVSDARRLEKIESDAASFELLMTTNELSQPVQDRVIKRAVEKDQDVTPVLENLLIETDVSNKELLLQERVRLLTEIDNLKKSNKSASMELCRLRSLFAKSGKNVITSTIKDNSNSSLSIDADHLKRVDEIGAATSPQPHTRESFSSLDLNAESFSTPAKTHFSQKALHSIDDHHDYDQQQLIDLSPPIIHEVIGFHKNNNLEVRRVGTESGNEKSDLELLDVSDSNTLDQIKSKDLDYDELYHQYYLLSQEVNKLKSELSFYYANSHQHGPQHLHHQQQQQQLNYHHLYQQQTSSADSRNDSFLDLAEPTELEYLRNVLYKYMLGLETRTLAKVICTVVKFSDDQTKKILEKEESRGFVFGPRKL